MSAEQRLTIVKKRKPVLPETDKAVEEYIASAYYAATMQKNQPLGPVLVVSSYRRALHALFPPTRGLLKD